ncbi:pseudouridine synthase [Ottowia thiooxydans]|uniref:pseudouridine synthase n=1 Tax=Ottowia thiooxydans TaxID=219182 RepID=UPI00040652A3|nr:pseudouridine synthase [Ottowia thiooxydans]
MAQAPRPLDLPLRNGVSPSTVAVPTASWPTVLDFLADRLPILSRDAWAARLAAGDVLGEDALPVAATSACRPGQRLHYYRSQPNEPEAPECETIVFQDEWLVVADKPHFMPVIPSGPYVHRSLVVRLKHRLGLEHLSPIHRIDRETAGLVAFAVQPATRAPYQALFRERAVEKVYEAVASYRPELELPRTHISRLETDPDRFFLSHEVPGPANSHTRVELIALHGSLAHYRLLPVTGQRHQLRIHMAALGIPILGDSFYPRVMRGPSEADDEANPLQLLARRLAFKDPVTGQEREFSSGLKLKASL